MARDSDERTPAGIEAQRQAALTTLAAARTALRFGMMETVLTKLLLTETHLRAMAPSEVA